MGIYPDGSKLHKSQLDPRQDHEQCNQFNSNETQYIQECGMLWGLRIEAAGSRQMLKERGSHFSIVNVRTDEEKFTVGWTASHEASWTWRDVMHNTPDAHPHTRTRSRQLSRWSNYRRNSRIGANNCRITWWRPVTMTDTTVATVALLASSSVNALNAVRCWHHSSRRFIRPPWNRIPMVLFTDRFYLTEVRLFVYRIGINPNSQWFQKPSGFVNSAFIKRRLLYHIMLSLTLLNNDSYYIN